MCKRYVAYGRRTHTAIEVTFGGVAGLVGMEGDAQYTFLPWLAVLSW